MSSLTECLWLIDFKESVERRQHVVRRLPLRKVANTCQQLALIRATEKSLFSQTGVRVIDTIGGTMQH